MAQTDNPNRRLDPDFENADGRIAAVAAEIPAAQSAKTVNVAGLYVTPGLVDMHVHVFAGTGTAYRPLQRAPRRPQFPIRSDHRRGRRLFGLAQLRGFQKLIIDQARTRVLAMLNIVGAGMAGDLEQNLQDMDPAKAAEMAARRKDIIVGFKSAHYAGPEWAPVENAVKGGEIAGVAGHGGLWTIQAGAPFEDLVTKKQRAGDIYTYMFLGSVPMLDDSSRLRPYLLEARKRELFSTLTTAAAVSCSGRPCRPSLAPTATKKPSSGNIDDRRARKVPRLSRGWQCRICRPESQILAIGADLGWTFWSVTKEISVILSVRSEIEGSVC